MKKCDFSGWATKNNIRCSDGRTIMKDAFKGNDGQVVPLIWQHNHVDPSYVIGHAELENKEEGVYAYCYLNNSEAGQATKELVMHGDISSLSIWANQLQQDAGRNVSHGMIREVSVVLAGANPGALIENVMQHGVESDEEAIIYTGEPIYISHSDEKEDKKDENDGDDEETVEDVFNTLTDKQKTMVYALVASAVENEKSGDDKDDSEGGDKKMKHNVFDQEQQTEENVLSHSEMTAIIGDAKRYGSLKESALAHGIENIEYLFPDAQNVTNVPGFIKRETGWVRGVMNDVHHTPFSRIKSMFADITGDEARAKGYIKGNLKAEEVFSLLKRTTDPTTVYKKQKLDRDDVIDITDFDVVAWLKSEMRMMLDEEIARAVLVGDGRLASSDDKIKEDNIRPIWKDADLYSIKSVIEYEAGATDAELANKFIDQVVRAMVDYQGSGSPKLYAPEVIITECLLLKDADGRRLYKNIEELATAMRVKEIVPVPVMAGLTRTNAQNKTLKLMGIVVNLIDYNIGADKGGAINMFDDFDIDYNAQKYLIETRCSGALIKPKSAIVLEAMQAE